MLIAFGFLTIMMCYAYACPNAAAVVDAYRLARSQIRNAFMQKQVELGHVCFPSRLRGHVTKISSGRCGAASAFLAGDGIAEARFAFEQMPIFAPCQVIVSHEHKFLYVRQPKAASTAITIAIEKTFGEGNTFVTNTHSVADEIWKDYFVFTFVRNPWTRAASSFNMMNDTYLFKSIVGAAGDPSQCNMQFQEFARNPASIKINCMAHRCCPRVGSDWVPWFADQHVNDQSGCVFSPAGESMVDYIGTSETVVSDWIDVVRAINALRGTDFVASIPGNPNGKGQRVQHRCGSTDMRSLYKDPERIGDVAISYAMDVLRFGWGNPRAP